MWHLLSLTCYCLLTNGQVVQLGGPGGPRPVTFGGSRSPYQTGPNYSHQLTYNGRPQSQQQQPQQLSSPPGFGHPSYDGGLLGRLPPSSSGFPHLQQQQQQQPIVLSQRIPAVSIPTNNNHGIGVTRLPSSTPRVAP